MQILHTCLILCLAPSLILSAALRARTTCHTYVIISTRGTSEAQGPSMAFVGMINQTLSAVPGGIEYDTVYPAGDNTQTEGAADVIRYTNAGLTACPNQKYALLGYSQGAVATAEALNYFSNTGSAGFKAIRAALVNGGRAIYEATGVYTFRTNLAKISPAWYATTKLRDICYVDDLVCNGLTLGATLNLFINHLRYGSTPSVQTQGSAFLIPLLN